MGKLERLVQILESKDINCSDPVVYEDTRYLDVDKTYRVVEENKDGDVFILGLSDLQGNRIVESIVSENRIARILLELLGAEDGGLLEDRIFKTAEKHSLMIEKIEGDQDVHGSIRLFLKETVAHSVMSKAREDIKGLLVSEGYNITGANTFGSVCEFKFDNMTKMNHVGEKTEVVISEEADVSIADKYIDKRANGKSDEEARKEVERELNLPSADVSNALIKAFGFEGQMNEDASDIEELDEVSTIEQFMAEAYDVDFRTGDCDLLMENDCVVLRDNAGEELVRYTREELKELGVEIK